MVASGANAKQAATAFHLSPGRLRNLLPSRAAQRYLSACHAVLEGQRQKASWMLALGVPQSEALHAFRSPEDRDILIEEALTRIPERVDAASFHELLDLTKVLFASSLR